MKYIFLSCFLPEPLYKGIVKDSKGSVSNAADALQKSFVEGLSENLDNLSIINFPSIGMWPKSYRKLLFKHYNYQYITYRGRSIECKNPSFLNLYMYSRHDIYRKICREIGSEAENTSDIVCVFVYAIMPWTMKACYKLKRKYGNKVKFVLIVHELPQYQGERKYYIQELLLRKRLYDYETYYKAFDGFILLTKYITERIPVGENPWTVIEGMFNFKDDYEVPQKSREKKTIFYAGTLDGRYGITNLVDAFLKTSNPNYRLILCGSGNMSEYIKEKSKVDKRIEYCGLLPRKEVLKKQREATLLVNPRTPEGEFTRYSFPSKTMEYLASGVPTLLYKLPGISEEYYDYCFSINELGVDALNQKIQEILSMDSENLLRVGKEARRFILELKNPYKQCEKVIELVNKIIH